LAVVVDTFYESCTIQFSEKYGHTQLASFSWAVLGLMGSSGRAHTVAKKRDEKNIISQNIKTCQFDITKLQYNKKARHFVEICALFFSFFVVFLEHYFPPWDLSWQY